MCIFIVIQLLKYQIWGIVFYWNFQLGCPNSHAMDTSPAMIFTEYALSPQHLALVMIHDQIHSIATMKIR